MKIQVEGKTYDTVDLIYVANHKVSEDFTFPGYYSETLYKTHDNNYLLMCYDYDDLTDKYSEREFKIEPNPGMWLLGHRHERLAGFMFPELRKRVEHCLHGDNLQKGAEKGETFYQPGEAKS